jgi:peptidoglycan/LPS O-acetylase OafA/YrhL
MSSLLSSYANSRDNNFNLVRFIAATLVLFSHSFAIAYGSTDAEPLSNIVGMTRGNVAVDVFFVTSGFLITISCFARNNLLVFA